MVNGGPVREMKRLLQGLARPSTFLPLVGLMLLAFGVSAQIVPQNTLAISINGLFIAVSIMIARAYGPALINSLRAPSANKDQYLVTGILLLWFSISASRVWSLALIMAGKPPWMINHWFQTFCYLVAASSGFYFLLIPGPNKTGFKFTTYGLMIAVGVVTAMLVFFEA